MLIICQKTEIDHLFQNSSYLFLTCFMCIPMAWFNTKIGLQSIIPFSVLVTTKVYLIHIQLEMTNRDHSEQVNSEWMSSIN